MIETQTTTPLAPTKSALIVAVAETERLVGHHRQLLDHTAAWPVPAHVSVLYPCVPPVQITTRTIEDIAAALSTVAVFECAFAEVGWFGEDVFWLKPEPDRHFRALTRAVWIRFPDYPPYRGAHLDPVPHLTIGDTHIADLASMQHAATAIQKALPVSAQIDRVQLISGTDAAGSWRTLTEFTLPPN